MAVTNPIYDIDMTGLEGLFEGVVAYVEVRSGFEDISNEIAREMRQMGAVVSDKRDNKVTHVIFREGTFRTSEWAKKHNVPLVGVGWLAASARNKMRFLCTPWREEYLIEQFDLCGLKKRIRYKKYCKAMNVEEFEAEMSKSAEKIKKKFNNSLNKSKCSVASDNAEYERIMKLSDPCLRRRPPTPEFVKKHIKRHERLRQGGRYSWESSDEDKCTSSEDIDGAKLVFNDDRDKENVRKFYANDVSFIEPVLSSPTVAERNFKPVKRRTLLTKTINHNTNSAKVLKELLPKAVQLVFKMSETSGRKRKRLSVEVGPPAKINKISDKLSVNESIGCNDNNSMDLLIKTPHKQIFSNKFPLLPLDTNKSPHICPSKDSFTTPKNKKKSLRTKLFENSAKKYFQENENSDCLYNEANIKEILVPDTDLVNKKHRPFLNSSPDICAIPETPLQMQYFSNGTNFDSFNSSNNLNTPIDCGQSNTPLSNTNAVTKSSTKKNVRRSIRISQCIDRLKNIYNPVLIEPKSDLKEKLRKSLLEKKHNVFVEQTDISSDIFRLKNSEDGTKDESPDLLKKDVKVKKNVRHSNKFSKALENTENKVAMNFNTENENTSKKKINIEIQTNVEKTKRFLKRQWSEIEPDKKEVISIKPKPLIKKFRDSRDDFVFNSHKDQNRNVISKSLRNRTCNEIVFVGINHEEFVSIKASCHKMPHEYICVDIIRTKEQLVVVSDKPKRSLELMKAFIFGNTFVSLTWIHKCFDANRWLNWIPYIITYSDITESPLLSHTSQKSSQYLFQDYVPMYISIKKNSLLPKYKLRLIIEDCGGIVTDSFRQAGIVIDTRKVNALSVTSSWILDCVKEGRIVDHNKYQIA